MPQQGTTNPDQKNSNTQDQTRSDTMLNMEIRGDKKNKDLYTRTHQIYMENPKHSLRKNHDGAAFTEQ